MSFSQLPAVKNDTIFGAARKFFGLSYFVTALDHLLKLLHVIKLDQSCSNYEILSDLRNERRHGQVQPHLFQDTGSWVKLEGK